MAISISVFIFPEFEIIRIFPHLRSDVFIYITMLEKSRLGYFNLSIKKPAYQIGGATSTIGPKTFLHIHQCLLSVIP